MLDSHTIALYGIAEVNIAAVLIDLAMNPRITVIMADIRTEHIQRDRVLANGKLQRISIGCN